MAKRKKGQLESVGKVLKSVYPAPDQLEAAKVFAWWGRSVPPRILEHARPVRLSRGVLVVHVSSSVWANELHYLTDDLLTRLREHTPATPIEKIRVIPVTIFMLALGIAPEPLFNIFNATVVEMSKLFVS